MKIMIESNKWIFTDNYLIYISNAGYIVTLIIVIYWRKFLAHRPMFCKFPLAVDQVRFPIVLEIVLKWYVCPKYLLILTWLIVHLQKGPIFLEAIEKQWKVNNWNICSFCCLYVLYPIIQLVRCNQIYYCADSLLLIFKKIIPQLSILLTPSFLLQKFFILKIQKFWISSKTT